jgi:ribosomal protein L3 glutamine methyltransferase
LIVTNPPYVSAAEWWLLPEEYRHEPRLGLEAGEQGLDVVTDILGQAAKFLTPNGVLVMEVGNSASVLNRTFPDAPFVWLDFERGGEGVLLITAADLRGSRDLFS